MAAAVMECDVVQILHDPSSLETGTRSGLVTYFFKFTKVTNADWLVTSDVFQSGTPLMWRACTRDSSSDGVVEETVGIAYTHSGTKLTFSGGTTGTTYGEIWYEEA